jgi:Flp pilus assembly pilin Flp
MNHKHTLAQGTTEYALILALAALAVLLVVALFGRQLAAAYQKAADGLTGAREAASIQSIAQDFMARALAYHQSTGKWPPTWGDKRFTDLSLSPADWQTPVNGIQWGPHGEYIGLANVKGDNIQVYVKDTNGNTMHLIDTWNIWCRATDGRCFYHTEGTGTEVLLSTVTVTGN